MLSIQELRSSTLKELLQELKVAKSQLLKTRIGIKTKHKKDSSLVNKQKVYAAQIKTIVRELELEEMVKNANQL